MIIDSDNKIVEEVRDMLPLTGDILREEGWVFERQDIKYYGAVSTCSETWVNSNDIRVTLYSSGNAYLIYKQALLDRRVRTLGELKTKIKEYDNRHR